MNVLSIFDGISCGQIVLRELFENVNYYSSEINKHTVRLTQEKFPDTIQLGDIRDYKKWKLPQIDLIIGGSPCQGFSFAGKELNFNDKRSKLFFEFVDCVKYFKPKYFFLENVVMRTEFSDVISSYLGVEPVLINSNLVSAQNRQRLYWANFHISQPNDNEVHFNDYIIGYPARMVGRRINSNGKRADKDRTIELQQYIECLSGSKSGCVTTATKDTMVSSVYLPRTLYNECRDLTRYCTMDELEWLQTLPKGYTESLPKTHRIDAIGNCWTIDVIRHIFGKYYAQR
jgi:DNA (cytosine-5)-methyltransferase 3A